MARGDYLPSGDKEQDANLPGMGGVFNYINLDGYQYAGQNPVRMVDPDGEKIYIVGSSTEVNAIVKALEYATGTKINTKRIGRNTIRITGFQSTDSRFGGIQDKLSGLINSSEKYKIKFDAEAALLGGGNYDDKTKTAALHPKLKKKNQRSFYYIHHAKKGSSGNILDRMASSIAGKLLGTGSKHKRVERYFNLWDVLTHEVLGHGHDDDTGKLNKFKDRDAAEWSAIRTTNKVRKLRGKSSRDALK